MNMISRLHFGSDVSSEWFDVFVRVGRKPHHRCFSNTEAGRKEFIAWAKAFGAKANFICMEHTGGFELDLAIACREDGFVVSLVDGARISKYRDSFGSAKAKTDALDAQLIARYLKERKPAQWSPRPDEYRILTQMVRHRTDLIQSKKAWACRSSHPADCEIVAAQRDTLLQVLELQLGQIEEDIKEHVQSHPTLQEDVRLLTTINGIDFKTAFRILAEMGPVTSYKTPRDLALAAGLCPIADQSGKCKKNGRLFKYGNAELRNAFYMPALVNSRANPKQDKSISEFIQRIRNNGYKTKKTVITATMRKLVHLVHGILKSRTPFDKERFLKDMRQPT